MSGAQLGKQTLGLNRCIRGRVLRLTANTVALFALPIILFG